MIHGIASIALVSVPTAKAPPRILAQLMAKAAEAVSRLTEQTWATLAWSDEGDDLDWRALTEALDARILRTSIAGKPAGAIRRQPESDIDVEGWRWNGSLHSSSLPLLVGEKESLKVSVTDDDGAIWHADVHAAYAWRFVEHVEDGA